MQMLKNHPDLRILDQTDRLLLGHLFEYTYLLDKQNGQELLRDDFYGDPACGLISPHNDWAVVAGEHLTIWRSDRSEIIAREELKWITAVRQMNASCVELLVDPWGANAAIWLLDVPLGKIEKVRDFKDYEHKEYTDNMEW
jgi:hypothetical protein